MPHVQGIGSLCHMYRVQGHLTTCIGYRIIVATGTGYEYLPKSKYTKRPWQMPHLPQLGGKRAVCGTCTPPPPSPSNLFPFFLFTKIRSMHDWSNDPEHWSSCPKCGPIGLLGDDGKVLAWVWMLPLIKSEGVMIC